MDDADRQRLARIEGLLRIQTREIALLDATIQRLAKQHRKEITMTDTAPNPQPDTPDTPDTPAEPDTPPED